MSVTFLGIDPGVNGSYAVISQSSESHRLRSATAFTGKSEAEICGMFMGVDRFFREEKSEVFCYIEKVNSIKGDGHVGAFTFGKAYGFVQGVAMTLGWNLYHIPPVVWQSRLACLTRGDKNVTKRKAIELYGDSSIRITHAIADAILIAHYGMTVQTQGK